MKANKANLFFPRACFGKLPVVFMQGEVRIGMQPTQLRKRGVTGSVVISVIGISVLLASPIRALAQNFYLSSLIGGVGVGLNKFTVLSATSLKEEQGQLSPSTGEFIPITSTVSTWDPLALSEFLPVSGYVICPLTQYETARNSGALIQGFVDDVEPSKRVYSIPPLLFDDNVIVCIRGKCDPNVPFITTESALPRVTPSQAYSYTLQVDPATGSPPFVWSLVSGYGAFPLGLTLAQNTGVISGTPTQAGTFAFQIRVIDSKQRAVAKNFSMTVAPPAFPNLTPYQPAGWSDKIVVSKVTGTTTDSSLLYTTDTLFVDWAVINSGTAPTTTGSQVDLYVDDVLLNTWVSSQPLNPNFFRSLSDYSIGSLTAGSHTITIKVDVPGAIAESVETDNEFTKRINVEPPALPNLAPFQPPGWADKLVVSTTTGTTVNSSSFMTTDTLYIDHAFINNGTTATEAFFYNELSVDGVPVHSFYASLVVNQNAWYSAVDYSIGSLSAGTHTISLKVDATRAISESDESDNEYSQTITVVAPVSTLTVTAPNGGENWVANSTRTVSWNISGSTGNIAYFKIALSTDGGVNYSTELSPIGLFTPSLRTWNWQIPSSLNSAQARIRVRALDLNSNILAQDSSDGNFTISGGDFPQPDFSLPAYRQDNPLWRAGFAPQSVNPPNPQLGNALGNCTWYANGRLRQLGFAKADLDFLINDASLWDNIAIQKGIPVSNIPVVGAIAQTDVGAEGRGHVAVVERVNGDGTITVSESSFAGENPPPTSEWNFLYRVRTSAPNWFQRFIHARKTLLTGVAGAALQPPNNGLFRFEVSVANQQQIVVQTSEDFVSWTDAGTVILTDGKGIFSDPTAGSHTKRFYRPKP